MPGKHTRAAIKELLDAGRQVTYTTACSRLRSCVLPRRPQLLRSSVLD
jgi:hypothetical protein